MKEYGKRLLNSKRVLAGDTYETLANYLGITRQALYYKVEGRSNFKQKEMLKIKEKYNLTDSEFVKMFEVEL